MPYRIKIIQAGYSLRQKAGNLQADGTITLITGLRNIIVDTGLPKDKELILAALEAEKLSPEDIDWIICTHGHSDHVGNNNLFSVSRFVVGFDYSLGDLYTLHDFASGHPLEIDHNIKIIPTPGHTGQDVSLLLTWNNALWAIAGDLFESRADLEDESLWREQSLFPKIQQQSRNLILKTVNFIVPGHGEAFKVK